MSKAIKALLEQKNDLAAKAKAIVDKAKAENRAVTADERTEFDNYMDEIERINATLDADDALAQVLALNPVKPNDKLAQDYKNFANHIRTIVNAEGDPTQLEFGENGAVIPTTIVKKIVDRVMELSPLYRLATRYTAKGNITIPVVDTSEDDITVAYADEFEDLASHSNKFKSITLGVFLFGALTKISKSLINNSDFDLVNFVIERMAQAIAAWKEKEAINGTASKIAGIAGSYDDDNMTVTLAKKSSVKADELIDLQDKIPDKLQPGACWIMSRATRTAIRKLKNGNGEYLLQPDFSKEGYNYTLLGKPVYPSENAPALGTEDNLAIIYLNPKCLAIKESKDYELQVLKELFAAQHAVGVVAWGEMDAKVENLQGVACAACGASD